MRNRLKFLFVFLLSVLTFPFLHVQAQSNPSATISVLPSIIQLDLSISKPETEITYANNTSTEVELSLSAYDFLQLEDVSKLLFLDQKESANYKYSLSHWIDFENANVVLGPGERKTIKIFIDNKNLTLGGHYATIQAEAKQSGSNEKQINIKGILSSLLFVRANTGNEIEEASIQSLIYSKHGLFLPKIFSMRLNNSGNVQLTPFGILEIKDPLGKVVSKGILNEGGLITLPESIRQYEIPVQESKRPLLPGFYTANLKVRYGKTEKEVTQSIRFFSIGDIKFLILSFTGILLLVIGLIISVRKPWKRIPISEWKKKTKK